MNLVCSAFIFLACTNFALAAINLVLLPDEVRRLLGLNRELSYIRNGIVNVNAINFVIPVSSNNDSVHFMWYNNDPTLPVSYKLIVNLMPSTDPETADDKATIMHQPSVNISHSGQVPQVPTIFRVALPCSGVKFGTVFINIDLTFVGSLGASVPESEFSDKKSPPTTKLRIKRSKTCSESNGNNPSPGFQGSQGKRQTNSVSKSDLSSSTPPHMLFFAALLSAIIVILILIMCIVIIHMRSRNKMPRSAKSNKPDSGLPGPSTSATTTTTIMLQPAQSMTLPVSRQISEHHIYEAMPQMMHQQYQNTLGARSGHESQSHGQNFELRQRYIQTQNFELGLMSDVAESRVTDWIHQQQILEEEPIPSLEPQEVFENLQVERSRLKLGSLLQEGTFSRVYQGSFEYEDGSELDVMIKTVLTGSSPAQSQMLVVEGVRLQGIVPTNKNLLQLLAATWDGTSPMLIYSYSAQGNLKQYLTKYASGGLSTHQVVRMGIHLLSAIGHLHKRGILHKDIAARNCFLAEGPTLKLGDSALSRDLFPNDYHCLGDNENRPIKWMPLESIAQGVFSRSSDVWSFGVVLWELMTRAQQPYPEIDPFEMEAYLNEGYRLPQPMNCPDQLFSVLVSCWGTRPQERASLQQLHQSLQALQRQLQQFV